jgi:hypothetical protein
VRPFGIVILQRIQPASPHLTLKLSLGLSSYLLALLTSFDSPLTEMSRSNDSAARNPVSLFSPDAYYFAPNTNLASSRNKGTSTGSTTSDNANANVNANAGSNSVASHTRAPSAGKSSSYTRSLTAGNDTLKPQPKSKRHPSSPVASTDVATTAPVPPVQSEPPLEPERRPSEHTQSTMGHKSPFILKMDKRHHAHPSSRAPYPRSYDTAAIDQ